MLLVVAHAEQATRCGSHSAGGRVDGLAERHHADAGAQLPGAVTRTGGLHRHRMSGRGGRTLRGLRRRRALCGPLGGLLCRTLLGKQ